MVKEREEVEKAEAKRLEKEEGEETGGEELGVVVVGQGRDKEYMTPWCTKIHHFQMEKKTIKVTYSFGADANGAAHLKAGRLQLHIRTTLVPTITIEVTTGVDLSRREEGGERKGEATSSKVQRAWATEESREGEGEGEGERGGGWREWGGYRWQIRLKKSVGEGMIPTAFDKEVIYIYK